MGLEIKLTESCNLSCDYCYYRGASSTGAMSAPVLEACLKFFIDRARAAGQAELDVTFFGGEPLLEEGLMLDCVRRLKANPPQGLRLRFLVCTNGTLLSHALLDQLEALSIRLYLSLDGPQDVQDRNRHDKAGNGSFSRIEPFIARLAASGSPIEKVIARNAIGQTADSIRFLYESGFRTIIASPDFSAAWEPEDLGALETQYRAIAAYKLEKARTGEPFHFSPFDDKLRLCASGQSYRDHSCNLGRKTFVVRPDSSIYPCTRFAADYGDERYCLGSVASGIDEGKRAALIAKSSRDKEECTACALRKRCLGNCCGCIAYSLGNDIGYLSPLVCEHERMLFRVLEESWA